MIDNQSIQDLKAIIDIVDIVGNYIELHKSGTSFKALCPFHEEKTPSFSLNSNKGLFYCFGCQKGGDAIKFVMEYEKLDYKEAVEKIAHFYNFKLDYTKRTIPNNQILESLEHFFKDRLLHNKLWLDYLQKRHVSARMRETFSLGFAPSNNEIMHFLQNHHYSMSDCLKLGVVGEDRGKFYARLKERLIFPIYSPQNKVVAFGGRSLENNAAKYLNSPQTPLFNKSRILYAYHLAKESVYKQHSIVITEGYLDTILLHQAGFTNSVATLGTALNKEHLPLLSKGEPRIILAYDGDKAGRAAALKASYLLAHKDGGVALLPPGFDPADMVVHKKIDELRIAFDTPIPFARFVIEEIVASCDKTNPLQKEKALARGNSFLRTLSPVLCEEYADLLATMLSVPHSFVTRFKQKPKTPKKSTDIKPLETARILKTLASSQELLDKVLEFVDTPIFECFEEEFELIKRNDMHHPKILNILLDERVKPLPTDEILKQLRYMLCLHYDALLKHLKTNKTIDSPKRSYAMLKIRNILIDVEKGKFPRFETFCFDDKAK